MVECGSSMDAKNNCFAFHRSGRLNTTLTAFSNIWATRKSKGNNTRTSTERLLSSATFQHQMISTRRLTYQNFLLDSRGHSHEIFSDNCQHMNANKQNVWTAVLNCGHWLLLCNSTRNVNMVRGLRHVRMWTSQLFAGTLTAIILSCWSGLERLFKYWKTLRFVLTPTMKRWKKNVAT